MLAAVMAFGAAVRLAIALHSGLWRDEALFLGVAGQPTLRDVLTYLRWHESHPPLFYLVARGWMGLFGGADRSVIWLALVFGIGLMPVCWWVGRRVFGRAGGLLGAGIVAASQMLALYGACVRPYAFLGVLTVITTYLLWRALWEDDARLWAAVAVATLALVYTHNWGWLVAGSHALIAMAWIAFEPRRRISRLTTLGATYAAVLIGFLPWIRALLYQAAHAGYPAVGRLFWVNTSASEFVLLGMAPGPAAVLLALPLGLAAWSSATVLRRPVVGVERLRAERTVGVLLFGGTAVIPLALAMAATPFVNVLKSQTFAIVAPCLALAVAALPSLTRGPRARAAASTGLGLYIGVCLIAAVRSSGASKSNAREIAAAVGEHSMRGDLVIQYPGFITSSFNRYFQGDVSQIAFPRFGASVLVEFDRAYERGMGSQQLQQTLDSLDAARSSGRGVWLVYAGDVGLVGPDVPADARGTSRFYFRARQVFVRQLWGEIVRRFGPPVLQFSPLEKTSYESLRAAYFRTVTGSEPLRSFPTVPVRPTVSSGRESRSNSGTSSPTARNTD